MVETVTTTINTKHMTEIAKTGILHRLWFSIIPLDFLAMIAINGVDAITPIIKKYRYSIKYLQKLKSTKATPLNPNIVFKYSNASPMELERKNTHPTTTISIA